MKNSKKSSLLLWPILLFGVYNFLSGFSILFSGLSIVLYSLALNIFQYMVTGLYEEVGLRGVLVNHMMRVNMNKKYGILYAILLPLFLFGILHINNIIRMGPQAIIQCIYAFAIGVVYAAAYIRTRNLWVSIGIHGIFNIIGSMTGPTSMFVYPGKKSAYPLLGIESFLISNTVYLSCIAILCIICIVAGLYMIRKSKHDEIKLLWKDEVEG